MSTPSTRIMHRSFRATPPVAVSGEGVWLVTDGDHCARALPAVPPSLVWAISIRA